MNSSPPKEPFFSRDFTSAHNPTHVNSRLCDRAKHKIVSDIWSDENVQLSILRLI